MYKAYSHWPAALVESGGMEEQPFQDQSRSEGISPNPTDLQLSKPKRRGFSVVVMGASGSGKSTVGELLGKKVPCPFIDADDFHTEENKEKMRNGVPLTEKDRLPWLVNLRNELAKYTSKGEWVVLACSALRPQYRNILLTADQPDDFVDTDMKSKMNGSTGPVVFAYLKGSVELFASRLDARHKEGKHFMPPSLLKSQLDTLEIIEGDHAIVPLDARLSPEEIVDCIINKLLLRL